MKRSLPRASPPEGITVSSPVCAACNGASCLKKNVWKLEKPTLLTAAPCGDLGLGIFKSE